MHRIPELWLLDALVGRRPHFDFLSIAKVKTVGDDAVPIGRFASGHVGLHWAGDGREAWHEFGAIAGGDERLHAWHMLEVLRA